MIVLFFHETQAINQREEERCHHGSRKNLKEEEPWLNQRRQWRWWVDQFTWFKDRSKTFKKVKILKSNRCLGWRIKKRDGKCLGWKQHRYLPLKCHWRLTEKLNIKWSQSSSICLRNRVIEKVEFTNLEVYAWNHCLRSLFEEHCWSIGISLIN